MEQVEESKQSIMDKSLLRALMTTVFIFSVKYSVDKLFSGHMLVDFMVVGMIFFFLYFLMNSYTPEFYKVIVSGIGWGLGQSVMSQIIKS